MGRLHSVFQYAYCTTKLINHNDQFLPIWFSHTKTMKVIKSTTTYLSTIISCDAVNYSLAHLCWLTLATSSCRTLLLTFSASVDVNEIMPASCLASFCTNCKFGLKIITHQTQGHFVRSAFQFCWLPVLVIMNIFLLIKFHYDEYLLVSLLFEIVKKTL